MIPAIALILLALLFTGWYFFNPFQKNKNPLSAVPPDAFLILEIHEKETFRETIRNSIVWNNLISTDDSSPTALQALLDMFPEGKTVVSFHYDSGIPVSLFIVSPAKSGSDNISGKPEPISTYKGKSILQIEMGSDSKEYRAFKSNGLLVISKSEEVIKKAIDQLGNPGNSLITDPVFLSVKETSGIGIAANLYVQNKQWYNMVKRLLEDHNGFMPQIFSLSDSWTGFDMLVKENEILFHGFTMSAQKELSSEKLLSGQHYGKADLLRSFPDNTIFSWISGFQDAPMYLQKIKDYLSQTDSLYLTDADLEILEKIDSEYGWGKIHNPTIGSVNQNFALIRIKKNTGIINRLIKDGTPVIETPGRSNYVYRFKEANPFTALFKPFYEKEIFDYFIPADSLIILTANQETALEIHQDIFSGRTLSAKQSFSPFYSNLSKTANLSFYLNSSYLTDFFSSSENKHIVEWATKQKDRLSEISGITIQYRNIDGKLYTSAYTRELKEPDLLMHKKSNTIHLDAPVRKGPYFVYNHVTGKNNLIVFDSLHQMYRINHLGKITWKIPVKGQVISDVFEVDKYRNGKIQYLFNTAEKIYLVDLNGNNVEGFPVVLPQEATNGLALFDYDNDKDYRILIACRDKKVYNYSMDGTQVKGWEIPRLNAIATYPVSFLSVNHRDYIIIPQENGNVLMTDRRGRPRLVIKRSFVNASQTDFYINRTNTKGMLITTDKSGDLVYIPSKGAVSKVRFDTFSPNHFFIYDDFNNNGKNDFLYLDGNKLVIYDPFKNILLEHVIDFIPSGRPQVLQLRSGEKLIYIHSSQNKPVFLSTGTVPGWCETVEGSTNLLYGKFLEEDRYYVITGKNADILLHPAE